MKASATGNILAHGAEFGPSPQPDAAESLREIDAAALDRKAAQEAQDALACQKEAVRARLAEEAHQAQLAEEAQKLEIEAREQRRLREECERQEREGAQRLCKEEEQRLIGQLQAAGHLDDEDDDDVREAAGMMAMMQRPRPNGMLMNDTPPAADSGDAPVGGGPSGVVAQQAYLTVLHGGADAGEGEGSSDGVDSPGSSLHQSLDMGGGSPAIMTPHGNGSGSGGGPDHRSHAGAEPDAAAARSLSQLLGLAHVAGSDSMDSDALLAHLVRDDALRGQVQGDGAGESRGGAAAGGTPAVEDDDDVF